MKDLKLRLPGGITIGFSGLDSEEAYYRAMSSIQTATAPLKIILNFLQLFQKLRDALASMSLSDLADFFDLLNVFIGLLSQLGQYIPQLSVPLMVIDILKLMQELLTIIENKIIEIETTISKQESVQAKLELDPNLQVVIDNIQLQINKKNNKLNGMMQPIMDIISILTILGDLIGLSIFEFNVEDNNSLSEIKNIISELKTSINSLITNLGV